MPSPFPGMNPFLEQSGVWHDFHQSFIPALRDVLNEQVLPRYFAKIEEHLTERLSYLEVRDRHQRRLIAVLELLSPSNKNPGRDRDQYLAKRTELLASSAHFVEIDLLRGGPPLPRLEPIDTSYSVLVSRAERRPEAGVWPIPLRERLPVIPVPLRHGEPDATVDLQAILHRIYDSAGYELYIYSGEPEPPLESDDALWAESFIPSERSAQ